MSVTLLAELASAQHQLTFQQPHSVTIGIGGIPICLRSESPAFCEMLRRRYEDFVETRGELPFELDVELHSPRPASDADVRVYRRGDNWAIKRGDFCSEWNMRTRSGWARQTLNPYSTDTVLRILHSLVLAEEGGFLFHASSAVRNGRAFVFAGVSGAGKTTTVRLAPRDATVLTDEISYVRQTRTGYHAFGTPFSGELGRPGENVSAPVDTVFLLEKAAFNRTYPVSRKAAALALMRHVLFFAEDRTLVTRVFDSMITFVSRVNVRRLAFVPDQGVWELIR